MANTIALAQKFLPMLDEVYQANSKTSLLDATQVEFVNGNTVKVYKTSMDGLGDYSRNGGFTDGDVNGAWETMTLTQDRGRSFNVDSMDDEESIGMAFGTLAGEFIRTKVVPEVDAYRFAKLAGTTGISTATPADVSVGTSAIPDWIDEANRQMNEDEVPQEGRIMFISETAYAGLKNKVNREIRNGEATIDKGIITYDNLRIVRVPQARFYTAITLADGKTSGQTAGGFTQADGSYKINFLILHPSAVCQVLKHVKPRIFDPDTNQKADAWKFDYRVYHDIFTYENKVKGIYLHRGATAKA